MGFWWSDRRGRKHTILGPNRHKGVGLTPEAVAGWVRSKLLGMDEHERDARNEDRNEKRKPKPDERQHESMPEQGAGCESIQERTHESGPPPANQWGPHGGPEDLPDRKTGGREEDRRNATEVEEHKEEQKRAAEQTKRSEARVKEAPAPSKEKAPSPAKKRETAPSRSKKKK